jgi:hypothetical protein
MDDPSVNIVDGAAGVRATAAKTAECSRYRLRHHNAVRREYHAATDGDCGGIDDGRWTTVVPRISIVLRVIARAIVPVFFTGAFVVIASLWAVIATVVAITFDAAVAVG